MKKIQLIDQLIGQKSAFSQFLAPLATQTYIKWRIMVIRKKMSQADQLIDQLDLEKMSLSWFDGFEQNFAILEPDILLWADIFGVNDD